MGKEPPTNGKKTQPAWPTWLKVVLTNLVLLSPLILGEILARVDMAYRNDPFQERNIRYKYTPYVGYAYRPFSNARPHLDTDRHGFIHNGDDRDRDLRTKPSDEFRVFMLGGSSVAGTYVRGPQDTLASMLERRLKAEFATKKIPLQPHVINMGVSSYFSAQEFQLLNFVVSRLHPDYVVFFDGANDCHFRYELGDYVLDETVLGLINGNYNPYSREFFRSYENMFSFTGLVRQAFILLNQFSALFRWFEEKHYSRFINKFDKETARARQILEKGDFSAPKIEYKSDHTINAANFGANIRSSISLASARPFHIAYLLQPSLMPTLVMSATEQSIAAPIMKSLQEKEICFQRLADEINAIRHEFDGNPKIQLADMRDVFSNKTADMTVYGDQVHYTNLGREIIVEAMMRLLGGNILALSDKASVARR